MMSALRPGETIIVDTLAYENASPGAGDIVAFRLRTRERPLVKRVIATAGDRLEFGQGGIVLNDEPVTIRGRRLSPGAGNFRILRLQLSRMGGRVPLGSLVVAGDSPSSEEDSGQYGLVADSQLIGKVVLVKDRGGAVVQRPGLPEPPHGSLGETPDADAVAGDEP